MVIAKDLTPGNALHKAFSGVNDSLTLFAFVPWKDGRPGEANQGTGSCS